MSFSCDDCGYQNNELQSGGEIQEKGIRIKLVVNTVADLNRTVVKSEHTIINVPAIEFEVKSTKGDVTTVESVISSAISSFQEIHSKSLEANPVEADVLGKHIEKLVGLLEVKEPFTMCFEDISGNCFVSNPHAPQRDPDCTSHHFVRTKEQDHALGIFDHSEVEDNEAKQQDHILPPINETGHTLEDLEGEVLCFRTNCPNCSAPCDTNMKMTNIPYFKEMVIMATTCEACGHRSNEVKGGGGIEPQGLKIEVSVVDKEDLCRDILKSETCSVSIPELDLEVGSAALGGKFTTVEGLIVNMKEQLDSQGRMFSDSAEPGSLEKLQEFLTRLDDVLKQKTQITLVLDDPAGNSYVQSKTPPDPDDGLKITHYERNFDQNEELGLNDMKTENYEEDS
ncbi:unnamed protein product [Bemisia tabaci]|nr:unnamed protein product [Bemisia tabaci]